MKNYFLWLLMITKRLFRKPLFLFTLLLIPLTVLLLHASKTGQDSAINVLLYTDGDKDSYSEEIVSDLMKQSGSVISFSRCDSPEEIRQEILSGRADCGYCFPKNMEQALAVYEEKGTPFIDAIYEGGNFSSALVQEMVFSSFYERLCFYILDTHVTDKTGLNVTNLLEQYYNANQIEESFFHFTYADGSENVLLNENKANYMLLPMRGIAAVFVLLSAMVGALFWYEDNQKQLFCWLSPYKKQVVSFFYMLIPTFLASVVGFCSIYLAGSQSSFPNECICMLLYVFATSCFCFFLNTVFPSLSLFLASIPLCIAGSLLLSPVFINLSAYNAGCKTLSYFTPVNYYLNSIYSTIGKERMLFFGLILLSISMVLRELPILKQKLLCKSIET